MSNCFIIHETTEEKREILMNKWCLLGLLMMTACSKTYIYDPSKYKSTANYTKVVTNRNKVILCSSTATASVRQAIQQEAKKECARFGKYAHRQSVTLATCPLSQAISWHYDCTAPKDKAQS